MWQSVDNSSNIFMCVPFTLMTHQYFIEEGAGYTNKRYVLCF